MTIELPKELEAALESEASAHGISAAEYVREVLERNLAVRRAAENSATPFNTGRGTFAKYEPAPSAEEIDANRAEMFRKFGEDF
jgi:hypothetical protein